VRRASALAALLALAACTAEPSAEEKAAWQEEIARLTAEADGLQARLRGLVDADPRQAGVPKGDVVIAVPTRFLEELIDRVFTDVASRVRLTLSGIKSHKEKTLRKGIPVGDFIMDLYVDEVHGRLAPGEPKVRFGGNEVTLTLPIEVVDGSGDATVHVLWRGRNVAKAVCGDLDVREHVSGSVKPARYVLTGTLALEALGAEIVGTPRFPETKVKLRVTPSQQSWAAIDRVLESKRGLCGWVLDRVDVKKLLAERVEEKGFDVKLPLHKIKPFRFPAGLSDSVEVRGKPIGLDVRAGTLRIDETAVWVGADVAVAAPELAEVPPPPP
jgi:hypothetical protein